MGSINNILRTITSNRFVGCAVNNPFIITSFAAGIFSLLYRSYHDWQICKGGGEAIRKEIKDKFFEDKFTLRKGVKDLTLDPRKNESDLRKNVRKQLNALSNQARSLTICSAINSIGKGGILHANFSSSSEFARKGLIKIYNSLEKRTWKNDLIVALKWATLVGCAFRALLYIARLNTRNITKQ